MVERSGRDREVRRCFAVGDVLSFGGLFDRAFEEEGYDASPYEERGSEKA
jgi:hypothetical protein